LVQIAIRHACKKCREIFEIQLELEYSLWTCLDYILEGRQGAARGCLRHAAEGSLKAANQSTSSRRMRCRIHTKVVHVVPRVARAVLVVLQEHLAVVLERAKAASNLMGGFGPLSYQVP